MKHTKPIYPQPDLNPKVISGEVTVFFDKRGLHMRLLNSDPNNFVLDEDNANILHRTDINLQVEVKPAYNIGEIYKWSLGPIYVEIVSAKLLRLENVTEENALRSGIKKTDEGYKHYCPRKLFPNSIIKGQKPGYPYMDNARSSFFTQWIDKYGILEVPMNPWIWIYEFKLSKNTKS